MFVVEKIDLPILGIRGLEADMSEEERAIQDSAHRFAEEVMPHSRETGQDDTRGGGS